MEISLKGVTKEYHSGGNNIKVLDQLSLEIKSGEFVSIIGPSGCGKTTLLRHIAGFDGGKPSKEIFMIFQDSNQLFPWKTLGENLSYAIRKTKRSINRQTADAKAKESLSLVGLLGFYDYYPNQLSGGMKQRGALARALAVDCRILLMDEPFSSLDSDNKELAYELLLHIWKEKKLTVIFVTHDLAEASRLSGRVLYFKDLNGKAVI